MSQLVRSFFILWFAVSGVLAVEGPNRIELWQGNHQVFGDPFVSQRWVNVLGHVVEPESVEQLIATLGGKTESLSLGGKSHRLLGEGDFNLEIPVSALTLGENPVQFRVIRSDGSEDHLEMILEMKQPEPAKVDFGQNWKGLETFPPEIQVVDGRWELTTDGLRPAELGYDRLISIGSRWWSDYEMTIPFIVHEALEFHPNPTFSPAIFLGTRWQGHRQWGNEKPAIGWWPLGGSAEIHWISDDANELRFVGNKLYPMTVSLSAPAVELGQSYWAKLRVETVPRHGSLYSFKIWKAGNSEPKEWHMKGMEALWDPLFGSVLLAAHHADVSFGGIQVAMLDMTPWRLLETFGGLAAQGPIFVVCLVGLGLAFRMRRASPRCARRVAGAVLLAAAAVMAGTLLDAHLPNWLHRADWGTHEIALALLIKDLAGALLLSISLGILLYSLVQRSD